MNKVLATIFCFFMLTNSWGQVSRPSNSKSVPSTVISIPYQIAEETPKFPGCEKIEEKHNIKKCNIRKFEHHFNKHFNIKNISCLEKKEDDCIKNIPFGSQKFIMTMVLHKSGKITNIKTRALHPKIEEEAKRVVKLIPNIVPGKQNDKPISVSFTYIHKFTIK